MLPSCNHSIHAVTMVTHFPQNCLWRVRLAGPCASSSLRFLEARVILPSLVARGGISRSGNGTVGTSLLQPPPGGDTSRRLRRVGIGLDGERPSCRRGGDRPLRTRPKSSSSSGEGGISPSSRSPPPRGERPGSSSGERSGEGGDIWGGDGIIPGEGGDSP